MRGRLRAVVLVLGLSFSACLPMVSTGINSWSALNAALNTQAKEATLVLSTPFDMSGYGGPVLVEAETTTTIVGNGAVFDAGGKGNFFQVLCNPGPVNFAIENVTMQNSNNQAAMYILDRAKVTVTRCTFSGNTAFKGGAVYIQHSNAAFVSCTFSANKVSGESAAGGAVLIEGKNTISFTSCTFAANTATGTGTHGEGGGGAIGIVVDEGGAVVLLKGCTWVAGAKGPGQNDIARIQNSPNFASVTFLCGDGFVGAPVQMVGNETSVLPPKDLKCTPV
jgi:predicted outer membrane repeat protein